MPYPNTDARRTYMRNYMRKRHENETPLQRERRLQHYREFERRRYHLSLERLGLEPIGSGHRRDWNF